MPCSDVHGCQLTVLHSEKKIDRLDRRLGEVLGLIQELKIDRQLRGTSQAAFGGSQPSSTSSPMPSSSITIKPKTSAILGVAGGSSLAAHSAFANDFMHHIANSDSLQSSGSAMSDTLGTLSNVVASLREQVVVNEMTYPHARPMQRPSLVGSELPPIQKSAELIRIAKSTLEPSSLSKHECVLTRRRSKPRRNRAHLPVPRDT
jgi:hypothetical protein